LDFHPLARIGTLWLTLAVICGVSVWAPPAIWNRAQANASADLSIEGDWQQWWDLAWEPLLEEDLPWLWAERGSQLIWSESAQQREQGVALLERTMNHPVDDPHALFRVALVCRNDQLRDWCGEHQVYQRLIDADPDNAVAYLLPISQLPRNSDDLRVESPVGIDSAETRSLLSAAASASRFDTYWGKGGPEMAASTEHVLGRLPLDDAGHDDRLTAARLTVSHLVSRPNLAYNNLYTLCTQQAAQQDSPVVADCLVVAELIQAQGSAAIDLQMGFGLERAIRQQTDISDPEGLRLWRQSRLWGRVYSCWMSDWMAGFYSADMAIDDVSDWLIDLDELGELEAARRTYLRDAGARAGDCDAMLALDDTGISNLLGEADPIHEWRALQPGHAVENGVL
jgi:hypothetical protein